MKVIEDFVPFQMAIKLKEKGLTLSKEYIFGAYDEDGYLFSMLEYNIEEYWCAYAPTISQVLKWLREEYHIHFEIVAAAYGYNLIISDTPDKSGTDRYYSHAKDDGPNDGGAWDSFEDCVMYGIEYVLDNLI